MTLLEAYQECKKGNFVSHKNFDENQSMHEYNNNMYYEDGANLTSGNFDLSNENWAKDGWFIKYNKNEIDLEKLEKKHKDNRHFMLQDGSSYEDCVIRKK